MAETHSVVNELEKEIEKKGSKLKSNAEDSWEDFIDLVKRHPGKALGITLAAGVALGSMAALKKRRYSATDQIRDLAGSGVDAWDRVKSGFDEAIGTLKEAMEDAVGKFK